LRCAGRLAYKRRVSIFNKWFTPSVSAQEKQLLQRCRGDQAQLERLITLELTRRAELSREAAAKSALDRWSRDR
jgi:hypothetical protein